jgi:SAM-dependent methyltransferase
MLAFVPASTTRLLDVGCDTGRFGAALRARFPTSELWGIDPAAPGRAVPDPYNRRITGLFPDDVPEGGMFDCIVFNDVLEHMADPWDALRKAHHLLMPGGTLIASIPNVRNARVVRPLVLRGRWDYADSGILDRTHLRFFTRSSAIALFVDTGYSVVEAAPVRRVEERSKLALANRLLGGLLDDFFVERYGIVALEGADRGRDPMRQQGVDAVDAKSRRQERM